MSSVMLFHILFLPSSYCSNCSFCNNLIFWLLSSLLMFFDFSSQVIFRKYFLKSTGLLQSWYFGMFVLPLYHLHFPLCPYLPLVVQVPLYWEFLQRGFMFSWSSWSWLFVHLVKNQLKSWHGYYQWLEGRIYHLGRLLGFQWWFGIIQVILIVRELLFLSCQYERQVFVGLLYVVQSQWSILQGFLLHHLFCI